MKKVIGLCLVVLLSSTSVFARENRRMDKRKMDPSARCEKMIADLKLDEKQAVEFRKLQKEYMEKAQKEREAVTAFGLYRWHILDPVRFEKDLKVTIQDLGWRHDGRYNNQKSDISSTTFWYQAEPHAKFPALPSKDDLEIPRW